LIREKSTLELSHLLTDINDYRDLWQIFQTTFIKIIPIDWIGIYAAPCQGEDFNVTSNPHLSFNWDELYQQIAPYDTYRERIINLPAGQPLIQEEIHNSDNETERLCLEYVVRHTDTIHMMAMTTVKDDTGVSLLGLYRCDKKHRFIQEEKQLFTNLGPLLGYAAKQMMLHQQHDFKRVAYDKLFEVGKIRPVFLDRRLRIIDLPLYTLNFLRHMFKQPLLEALPSEISTFISFHFAPNGRLEPNNGPWRFRIKASRGDLVCHAHMLIAENKVPVLILRLEKHGRTENFSIFAKVGLTARRIETLSYLPLGYTNPQIAMAIAAAEGIIPL
jgi:hypothetical protein